MGCSWGPPVYGSGLTVVTREGPFELELPRVSEPGSQRSPQRGGRQSPKENHPLCVAKCWGSPWPYPRRWGWGSGQDCQLGKKGALAGGGCRDFRRKSESTQWRRHGVGVSGRVCSRGCTIQLVWKNSGNTGMSQKTQVPLASSVTG